YRRGPHLSAVCNHADTTNDGVCDGPLCTGLRRGNGPQEDGKLTDIVSSRDSAPRNSKAVPEPGHVLALDGIRGLAILAVLASHLLSSNNVSPYPALQLLLDIRDMLWVGVTLFFALSGFLITGILFDTLGL